jgi:hypothetical protein
MQSIVPTEVDFEVPRAIHSPLPLVVYSCLFQKHFGQDLVREGYMDPGLSKSQDSKLPTKWLDKALRY